jgi:hypothetical protein
MDVQLNSQIGIPQFDFFDNFKSNPVVIIICFFIIFMYYFLFSSLGTTNANLTSVNEKDSSNIGLIMLSVFILLIIINGFGYFYNINIIASIKNLFTPQREIDITIESDLDNESDLPEIRYTKQAYHIPGNEYNYKDADAVCKAYGNRLASVKEVRDAYNKGAGWCSYGWSEGQQVLFPTQDEKWDKLQKIQGHENDCGRPGVNGGYVKNSALKFGVNCFGYKPKQTNLEAKLMRDMPEYPKTKTDIEKDRRVDYWKSRINDIVISPFNNKNWSVF